MERGKRLDARKAIILAQPLPSWPNNIVPALRVIKKALERDGRHTKASQVGARINGEEGVDAAIANNDAALVERAFTDGARFTLLRLHTIFDKASLPGAPTEVFNVACRFIEQQGKVRFFDWALSRMALQSNPSVPGANALTYGLRKLPDTAMLVPLLRSGFSMSAEQFAELATGTNPTGMSLALQIRPQQEGITDAFISLCTAPGIALHDRLDRLTLLRRAGADVRATRRISGFERNAGFPSNDAPALPAFLAAFASDGQVTPILTRFSLSLIQFC